jgi:MoaA/NifB/PqqE/SkfB family radical SAM enzyme
LRCLHCYSSSGPAQRDQLDSAILELVISDARKEGYRVVSFSGGEPTLYKDLPRLLQHSRNCGMNTTVTSNGMLLSKHLLELLAPVTGVLAISLDGIPESHNKMRESPRAFEQMEKNLPNVRASGIVFGFIFTLTQYNLNEIEWAADFACRQGAKLFQIHPLEEVGRAAQMLSGVQPDGIESAYGYLEVERIRKLYAGKMAVQLDLVHAKVLGDHPDRFFDSEAAMTRPLGDLVSPLVIEADGRVVPFGYGFASQYALGSLKDARLPELAASWRVNGHRQLQSLCRTTFEDAVAQQGEFPILNWWGKLGQSADLSEVPPVR